MHFHRKVVKNLKLPGQRARGGEGAGGVPGPGLDLDAAAPRLSDAARAVPGAGRSAVRFVLNNPCQSPKGSATVKQDEIKFNKRLLVSGAPKLVRVCGIIWIDLSDLIELCRVFSSKAYVVTIACRSLSRSSRE